MTTPENFKRRQQRELALVGVLLAGTLVYGWFDSVRESANDSCMAQSFQASADVTKKRAAFVERADEIKVLIDANQSKGLTDMASSVNRKQFYAAREAFQKEDERLNKQLKVVQEKRAATKIPDFPDGKCEDG